MADASKHRILCFKAKLWYLFRTPHSPGEIINGNPQRAARHCNSTAKNVTSMSFGCKVILHDVLNIFAGKVIFYLLWWGGYQ